MGKRTAPFKIRDDRQRVNRTDECVPVPVEGCSVYVDGHR